MGFDSLSLTEFDTVFEFDTQFYKTLTEISQFRGYVHLVRPRPISLEDERRSRHVEQHIPTDRGVSCKSAFSLVLMHK